MRKVYISILIVLVIIGAYGFNLQAGNKNLQEKAQVKWEEIKELVNTFLINPDKENAQLLYKLLPPENKLLKEQPELAERFLHYLIWERDAKVVFTYEIITGNINAAKLAYKLLIISDGYYAEEICRILSCLIRINPRLFLEVILSNPDDDFIKFIVRATPFSESEIYENNFGRMYRNECLKRAEALRTVNDPELRGLRDRCLAILLEELRK